MKRRALVLFTLLASPCFSAQAAVSIPLTVNTSEAVTVDTTGGTPRIAVDVSGNTRYATYTAGSGTSALTFTLSPTVGDVDLDGVVVSSPIDLNGGTIKDSAGNNATLTFTPPNTSGIKVDYPSLSMDFINNDYILSGTHYNTLTSFLSAAGGSFTRASTATYFDAAGNLQTAASGAPRFDYNPTTHTAKGILIEESRTNSVANSTMTGAVTGVIGSGGTMPTSWFRSTCSGLSYEVIGTGTVTNLPYLDMRVYGTNTSGAICYGHIYMQYNFVPVSPGEKWALSAYTQLISGTHNAATMGALNLGFQEFNSSGTFLTGTTGGSTISSTFTKQTMVATVNNASTTQARMMMNFGITNGTALDITVRIAAPQMEKGPFSTSFIPTSSGAVTRSADALTLPTGGWYNSTSGTILSDYSLSGTGGNRYPGSVVISDGGFNNGLTLYVLDTGGLNKCGQIKRSSTVSYGPCGSVAVVKDVPTISVLAYADSNSRFSADNVLASLGASASIPTVSTMYVGGDPVITGKLDGNVRRIKYYPARVADTQVQLLSQ